jgi:hypothetical protein
MHVEVVKRQLAKECVRRGCLTREAQLNGLVGKCCKAYNHFLPRIALCGLLLAGA